MKFKVRSINHTEAGYTHIKLYQERDLLSEHSPGQLVSADMTLTFVGSATDVKIGQTFEVSSTALEILVRGVDEQG